MRTKQAEMVRYYILTHIDMSEQSMYLKEVIYHFTPKRCKMIHIYTLIRIGFHQNPIPSGNFVTSKVSFSDFRMMLNAPLISAFIILPE